MLHLQGWKGGRVQYSWCYIYKGGGGAVQLVLHLQGLGEGEYSWAGTTSISEEGLERGAVQYRYSCCYIYAQGWRGRDAVQLVLHLQE